MQTLLFSFTLLISAFLLFWIQPLIGKVILPVLGGTPAVWNTCMMFFQGALLLGYAYVHFSVRLLNRWQSLLHLLLILLALWLLPIPTQLLENPPTQSNPLFWLIGSLIQTIGLPLLVISATAPLLQIWYTYTQRHSAKDPYFLYSASNLGSMLGLLCFPFLLEPTLTLIYQNWLWSVGFGLLGLLVIACRASIRYTSKISLPQTKAPEDHSDSTPPLLKPNLNARIRWILLAFVPSSLLLSTTTILTTDIAAVPLFWVIPLALYILSFIIVFAKRPWISHNWIIRNQTYFFIPLLLLPFIQFYSPSYIPFFIPIYLIVFFVMALVCHGELVRLRPQITHLSEFYLWIAIGGLLGSMFNVLLAPMIFKNYTEFALVFGLGCLLRPHLTQLSSAEKTMDHWIQISSALVITAFLLFIVHFIHTPIVFFLLYLMPVAYILGYPERTLQFGLSIIVILLLMSQMIGTRYVMETFNIIDQKRNFFGITKVVDLPSNQMRMLIHGRIIHGIQSLNPELKLKTSGYYTPLKSIFTALSQQNPHLEIAVAGLGAGKLACFARPSDTMVFYEINPDIVSIAKNHFDFLKHCPPQWKVILGDARLSLKRSPDHFQLIILDAFSSDSVPIHLMTLEATEMYLKKLTPNGILLFHISNHYLNLAPVLSAIAHHLDLAALTYHDSEARWASNPKFGSRWVAMAKQPKTLEFLKKSGWKPLTYQPNAPIWTDHFSNILSVFINPF